MNQDRPQSRSRSWRIAGAAWAIYAGLWLIGHFPIFGGVVFLFIPTVVLAALTVTIAAAIPFFGIDPGFKRVAAIVFVALVAAGIALRFAGNATARADFSIEPSVIRSVQLSSRTPVFVSARNAYRYDTVPGNVAGPSCDENACIMFTYFGWAERPAYLKVKEVVAGLYLDPEGTSSAKAKVLVESHEDGQALDLAFEVRMGEETLGTLKARLPAYGRRRTAWIPSFLRYSLENNPLSLLVSPKPILVDEAFLRYFLRSVLLDYSKPRTQDEPETAGRDRIGPG